MWLYPLPALLASAGFLFILISRKNFLREIRYAAVILAVGLTIYMVRSWRNGSGRSRKRCRIKSGIYLSHNYLQGEIQ